jgi:hypothetical protein
MGKIDIDSIGKYNKQLVLDLKAGKTHTSGTLISTWRHDQNYNYDLSRGITACGNPAMKLQGKYVGEKYYCATKDFQWDMAKRIVHVYDTDNKAGTQKFYRLIHTKASDPQLRDNQYGECDEITGI